MRITKELALEVKMFFGVHCLRHLGKEIQGNYLNECRLEVGEDGEYYILITLKKALPNHVRIPREYRGLRIETQVL